MADTGVDKKFLIVFMDDHLTYSPSTLNLFYTLKKYYDVDLISARQPGYYSVNEVTDANIKYIDFKVKRTFFDILKVIFYKISDKIIKPTKDSVIKRSLSDYKTKYIINYIKKTTREIIAKDTVALWCAQQAGKKAHLLSLEIFENDPYLKNIQLSAIKSVIIQSEARLNFMFPKDKPRYFIVQNAPKSIDFVPAYTLRKKTDLVYCGSAVYAFGIITCLDFIKDYKQYTLTVKGAFPKEIEQVINEFYSDLIIEKRLIIESDYLSETELTHYISKFRIGFAFYDLYRFAHLRTFNYYTAPSGKVFQYLNSGIPVIANSLPAFEFIEENHCGKLISHLSSNQIKSAIDAIENDYLSFAENAKRISSEYDFNKMIQPFLDYIGQEETDNLI